MAKAKPELANKIKSLKSRFQRIEQESLKIRAILHTADIADIERRQERVQQKLAGLSTDLLKIEKAHAMKQANEIRALKRRHRRWLKAQTEQNPLAPFLYGVPPKPGRPKRTKKEQEWATEATHVRLMSAMRKNVGLKLKNNPAIKDFNKRIAKALLETLDPTVLEKLRKKNLDLLDVDYLRDLVRELIDFAVKALGPAPPGREERSERYRAIDLILGDSAELESRQQAKLQK